MKRIRKLLPVLIVVFSLWVVYHQVKEWVQARAARVESVNQMRDLSAAAMAYAATHGNSFPTTIPMLLAASPLLPPGPEISPLASDKTKPSYEMVAPAQPFSRVSDPARTPMIRSVFTTKNGERIIVFCDGHIETVSE